MCRDIQAKAVSRYHGETQRVGSADSGESYNP
jgi:hypothetical protein